MGGKVALKLSIVLSCFTLSFGLVDTLDVLVLTENLEHIDYSQPLGGPNVDPFDRMITVPQMIDCLIELFNRSNAVYREDSGSDQEDGRNGFDMIDSSRKCQKCSKLPPGTKPLNVSYSLGSTNRSFVSINVSMIHDWVIQLRANPSFSYLV
ncbi:hypothetical protein P879_11879 [Paragonimus westermani]|uniref:Uncharacterized protein n=1 Tax=Paragonimus westermani TaxID=34504 RepID=A0A8T0D5R3_9TREM|nr:hypothetical protein P879_11879 [Paragonimus westermani]